ncbi:MAG: ABC transporter substrate-binding protein [Firmicutes bacterium]|nr:ABC transporter substrate-binding protein [Bacillota bacterium]
MRKNSLLALFLVCLLLLTNSLTAREESTVEVMVLSGVTGLSFLPLLEEEPSIEPGIKINYTVVKSPDQMRAKIISGEADIAAVPTNLAAILYNNGIPIQLAAITNWGVMYLVEQGSQITSWSDLRGKTIGVTGKGSTPDILFRYFLTVHGLDPERDVQIQYYPTPVELAQLAIAGKVEIATLPEPWVTEVVTRNPSFRVCLDYQKEWERLEQREESYAQSALVVQTALAQKHPEFLQKFLRQADAASAWVVNNPAAAGKLAQTHIMISAEAAGAAIPRCNLRFKEAALVRAEVEYYLAKLLSFQPQSIGGKLPDEGFYLQK